MSVLTFISPAITISASGHMHWDDALDNYIRLFCCVTRLRMLHKHFIVNNFKIFCFKTFTIYLLSILVESGNFRRHLGQIEMMSYMTLTQVGIVMRHSITANVVIAFGQINRAHSSYDKFSNKYAFNCVV